MDPNVLLKLRLADIDIAKKHMGDVVKEYATSLPGHELNIEFDTTYLPAERFEKTRSNFVVVEE